ncbi:DUF4194 domain-containing protein [Dyella sp. 20L07]|uniref:DUF4194 domain-containing protein n=1 Tax=Dyella sp. 20L07 TaxID=3384240 RepID=UPI003D29C783
MDNESTELPMGGPLYVGDSGTLPMDTRLTLCKLLQGPFIDSDSPHWTALLRDESILKARLSDFFLELILDRERLIAFTRQANTGELDTPVLLRSAPLTYIDSVLIIHLRERLIEAESRHERAAVDEDLLVEHLGLFLGSSTDAVNGRKRISAAIDKMRKNNILQNIRGADRRFEISPTLRLLFSANDVEFLGRVYRKIADGEPVTPDDLKESQDDET